METGIKSYLEGSLSGALPVCIANIRLQFTICLQESVLLKLSILFSPQISCCSDFVELDVPAME